MSDFLRTFLKWGVFALTISSLAYALTGEPARVLRIIDGDTMVVRYHDRTEHLRFLGVDAPESHYNAKLIRETHNDPEKIKAELEKGQESTTYLQTLVHPGDTIGLVFDIKKRDKYHRLLAYLYLEDGTFLNQNLIDAGKARWMIIPPNVHFPGRK